MVSQKEVREEEFLAELLQVNDLHSKEIEKIKANHDEEIQKLEANCKLQQEEAKNMEVFFFDTVK